jgi:hypothetical protein
VLEAICAGLAKPVRTYSKQMKNMCEDTSHTSTYTTNFDYVTLETKSNSAIQTIVRHRMPNINEINLVTKAGFEKKIHFTFRPL